MLTCYAHIGQHSSCNYSWARSKGLRHATHEEYAPLLHELQAIGYVDLKIIKRISQKMHAERRALERA